MMIAQKLIGEFLNITKIATKCNVSIIQNESFISSNIIKSDELELLYPLWIGHGFTFELKNTKGKMCARRCLTGKLI
jgi:hypothetical protein